MGYLGRRRSRAVIVTIREVMGHGDDLYLVRSDNGSSSTGTGLRWALNWALGDFCGPGDEVTIIWGDPTSTLA